MKTKAWLILAIVLVGGTAEGIIVLVAAGVIPTCGCQNSNGQPYPWCPVLPCPQREGLTLDSSILNSPTSMTVSLRNIGFMTLALNAYYVKDSSGTNNQYANSNWSGPTIQPNTVVSFNILIDGKAFTFQSNHTYQLTVITLRNNQFIFAVTA